MGIQWSSASAIYRVQEGLWFSWEGGLFNILIAFGIPIKLVSLRKMCLNETYSIIWVGKHLTDMLTIRSGLKQWDAFSPLFFNIVLEYVTKSIKVNQDGLKLNGTHQLLVYVDDVNILAGSLYTTKENTDVLLVRGKEIGLEVNADKTRCMVMSRDENAGRSHNIKILWRSFERVEFNNLNKSKFYSGRYWEQIEVRECLLSFGESSFVFQFVIQKFKD